MSPEGSVTCGTRPRRRRWRAATVSLCLLAAGASACGTAPQRSALLGQAEHVQANERAMRLSLYEYSYLFARSVERTADGIASSQKDPKVLRAASDWKRGATSEVQRAAFQQDVLVGVLDAWTLALQQEQFFDSGAGRTVFGDAQPVAKSTSHALVESMEAMVRPWADQEGLRRGAENTRSFARANPIEDLSFTRRSIAPALAHKLEAGHDELGMPQMLANMQDSVEDLMQRTTLYAAQIPRQATWEGEELLDDFLEKPRVVGVFDAVDSMRNDVSKVTAFTDRIPALITSERLAAFEGIAKERRIALEAVTAERVAMVDAIAKERELVMTDAHAMLRTVLEDVTKERQAILRETPRVASEALGATQKQLQALVDRVLWGLLAIVALAGAVLFLGALVLLKKRLPKTMLATAASTAQLSPAPPR
jgi:hypothetical protein